MPAHSCGRTGTRRSGPTGIRAARMHRRTSGAGTATSSRTMTGHSASSPTLQALIQPTPRSTGHGGRTPTTTSSTASSPCAGGASRARSSRTPPRAPTIFAATRTRITSPCVTPSLPSVSASAARSRWSTGPRASPTTGSRKTSVTELACDRTARPTCRRALQQCGSC